MKGFFLSAEAILSLVIAISALSLLAFPQQYAEPESNAFTVLSHRMHDTAITGFYLRKTPAGLGLKDASNLTKKYWKCKEEILPTEESSPFNNKPDFQKYSYCEETA